jgi:hypothetical protein
VRKRADLPQWFFPKATGLWKEFAPVILKWLGSGGLQKSHGQGNAF